MTCPTHGAGTTKNTKKQDPTPVHSSFLNAEFISVSTTGLVIHVSSPSLLSCPKGKFVPTLSLPYHPLYKFKHTYQLLCLLSLSPLF